MDDWEKKNLQTVNRKGNSMGLKVFTEPMEVVGHFKYVPMRALLTEAGVTQGSYEASERGWDTAPQPHQQQDCLGDQQKEKISKYSTFTTTFSSV